MIKVIIVEDNHEFRNTIRQYVDQNEGFTCIAAFSSAEAVIQTEDLPAFNVGLIDINLPGITGIELVGRLKKALPSSQFIMLTIFEDSDSIFSALKAGATGYLIKNTAPERILEAIKEVHEGGSPMSGPIARKVISSFAREEKKDEEGYPGLSRREFEIIRLISQGYRYKEISTTLFISVETVRTHIRNVYQKLQVQSGIEAINKIFKNPGHPGN